LLLVCCGCAGVAGGALVAPGVGGVAVVGDGGSLERAPGMPMAAMEAPYWLDCALT